MIHQDCRQQAAPAVTHVTYGDIRSIKNRARTRTLQQILQHELRHAVGALVSARSFPDFAPVDQVYATVRWTSSSSSDVITVPAFSVGWMRNSALDADQLSTMAYVFQVLPSACKAPEKVYQKFMRDDGDLDRIAGADPWDDDDMHSARSLYSPRLHQCAKPLIDTARQLCISGAANLESVARKLRRNPSVNIELRHFFSSKKEGDRLVDTLLQERRNYRKSR